VNLDATVIPIRIRRPTEAVDLALVWFTRRGLAEGAGLCTLLLLPMWVVCSAICLLLPDDDAWAAWLLAWALGGLASGLLTPAFGWLLFGEQASVSRWWESVRQRLGAFVALWGLVGLARLLLGMTVLGAALLPGLYFTNETFWLERQPLARSVRRSSQIASRASAIVATQWFVSSLTLVGMVALGEAVGIGLFEWTLQLGRPGGALSERAVSPEALLGFFVGVPIVTFARLLHYVDVRSRLDGWDLQVELMGLARRDGQESA
jgi:hypothetical protein